MKTAAFLDLLHGKTTPAVPFWETWFCHWTLSRELLGEHYGGEYFYTADRMDLTIRLAQKLGWAAVPVGGVPVDCHFMEYQVTTTGDARYSAEGLLRTRDQLEKRPLPDWTLQTQRMERAIRQVHDAGLAAIAYQPWCFHTIATSIGLETFAISVYDQPEFIQECLHWVEERTRRAIRDVLSQVRPDAVLFDGDCAYKNGLMVSPRMFRQLVFDETRQTTRLLQEAGIPYTFHTDGKLDDVIPLLVELGFAVVHGCEKQANDLHHLVETFGDRICLSGNMDVVFLTHASPADIRKETEAMILTGHTRGKYIAACNTSPQDYIPHENYMAMVDVIRHF